MKRSIDLICKIESEFLTKLDNMMMMGTIADHSSHDLKRMLQSLAPLYDELIAINKTLKGAVYQHHKRDKEQEKATRGVVPS